MQLINPVPEIYIGVPVNDETNRKHGLSVGWPARHLPWPPHSDNAVISQCQTCGGAMAIGPMLVSRLIREHDQPTVICLICAGILAAMSGARIANP